MPDVEKATDNMEKDTEKLASFADELTLLEMAARDAGSVAMRYFNRDPQVWTKGNDSPVTEADLAVDKMLHVELLGARPDYGWLSEETEDNLDRLEKQRVFVVDPIDGTRAFIDGGEDWTISVALVEGVRPVAAALYAPVKGEMYLAYAGGGASLNGEILTCPDVPELKGARTAGPRPAIHKGPLAKAGVKGAGYVRSLAYRIAMVANGEIDLALARGDANDWDLAAADLILTESGGCLLDEEGQLLTYNRPHPTHAALFGACKNLSREVEPLVKYIHFPERHKS